MNAKLPGPLLSEDIAAAKEWLRAGREKLRLEHQRGTPGIQICAQLTDLLDAILLDIYRAALRSVDDPEVESLVALVAHGGYGRRDVAPFSDVDLMLLHAPGAEDRVAPLARHVTHRIYDIGLQLGFSLRTVRQAQQLSMSDATVFTSLAESRYLAGSADLFHRFMARFRQTARRGARALVKRIVEARREERTQFGETVYLLEPNIKRSRGGLREIQLVRWIGFARYGESEPDNLCRLGALHDEDYRRLRAAREFLLRLRNEMHFHAGKSQDVLGMTEQVRLAETYGYRGSEGVLPVEQFMRVYFEHTSDVRYLSSHFARGARPYAFLQSLYDAVASRRAGPDYHLGPRHVRATKRGLEKLRGDLTEVLKLMELANLSGLRIHHDTWKAIREAMMEDGRLPLPPQAADRFLALISSPGNLGEQLRRLHQLRVLEQIIPGMRHARCLLQFNEYHKYTVDEHSFRAVDHATSLINDPTPLGDAYRGLKVDQKRNLHLALLLHDLGKGFLEDHSDVGKRLAGETAEHLNLPADERETLEFLVHKHLLMSHIALRQNLDDESVVVGFAGTVGSPEYLQMLYVLTCCDMAAVGPGVLNRWKQDLVTDLYFRTRRHLTDGGTSVEQWANKRREETLAKAPADDPEWWERQIAAMPSGYLFSGAPQEICNELAQLRELPQDKIQAWCRFMPDRNAMQYAVAAHEGVTEGIFHKLTGALTSKGMGILSAEIHTLPDRLLIDRFYVSDLDFQGEPPPERRDEVCEALVQAVLDKSGQTPAFRRVWKSSTPVDEQPHALPNQVRIDNGTSDLNSIIAVIAYDRMGLLYSISRALFELGLSINFAKIATYLDQVVDVFYVTEASGGKITDKNRQREIRERLLKAIEMVGAVEQQNST